MIVFSMSGITLTSLTLTPIEFNQRAIELVFLIAENEYSCMNPILTESINYTFAG